ncbi:MAG TPA: SpoIIE family protein phosphatase, partial [Gemmatimonadaceae bacterium]|nr:SpoIIE family protein phosphatase [Gemmatimonadaceae bacterium]
MSKSEPAPTVTSLRVLPRIVLIGSQDGDSDPRVEQLEGEGYLVISEADFARAIPTVRFARCVFVVIDIDSSLAGAQTLIETLRGDEGLAGLPVLVTSRRDDMNAIDRCLECGADDYLPSVFGKALLRTRISAVLDRRRIKDGENLRREMTVARTIQRDFLPESLPDVGGLELQAALHPAKDVSGDFYDCFLLSSGEVILVVGDVCDKGVGAALFMALFRSLIRASADPVGGGAIQMIGGRHTMVMQAIQSASPADTLTRVAGFTNDYIARLHGRPNM